MLFLKEKKQHLRLIPPLLTSIIPLNHSHRLVAFIRFYITQFPPSLILYLEDKPQFIPTQRQAEKNTAALGHSDWMWKDD